MWKYENQRQNFDSFEIFLQEIFVLIEKTIKPQQQLSFNQTT